MAKEDKTKLGYLGEDFQYRLVKAFFERRKFFDDLNTIVDQNMFTESYLRTIVGIMKDYFNSYGSVISYELMESKLRSKSSDEDESELYCNVLSKIRRLSTEGLEEIERMAEHFFKQQNMIRISNEIKKIAGDGDIEKYEDCYKLFENAMAIGRHDDNTSKPLESVEDDLSKENVITIPTGIKKLDDCLGGGLDKGKVGIIIGSMGFGKTSMTTCMAANAATYKCDSNFNEGFKVLQIIFEDTHRDIHRKYFSKISQVETCKINESDETTNRVREILRNSAESEMINNNILIMRLPSGEKTATDIKNEIKKKVNEGFKPDLVIVDYFGCVASERGSDKSDITDRESRTMRKFETMAAELDMAFWIPVQGNRDSISAELVTNDKIGGSISKNQIAQVVISITRSVDDIHNQRATLAVLKNRSGSAGITLNGIVFNNGTCTIESSDVVEFEDALSYNEYAEFKEKETHDQMVKELRSNFKLNQN